MATPDRTKTRSVELSTIPGKITAPRAYGLDQNCGQYGWPFKQHPNRIQIDRQIGRAPVNGTLVGKVRFD
jgi:hypothetical protein